MRPIPVKMRSDLAESPRMKRCALSDSKYLQYRPCRGRIPNPEWHHVWTYAGRQINEPWAILPACSFHHEMVDRDGSTRRAFQKISLETASIEDLAKYPKKSWTQIKKHLKVLI